MKAQTYYMRLCTGHYLNYYDTLGRRDIFIIINEGNYDATDPLPVEKLHKAEEICERCIATGSVDKLQDELEEVFEFGVQIFDGKVVKMFERETCLRRK